MSEIISSYNSSSARRRRKFNEAVESMLNEKQSKNNSATEIYNENKSILTENMSIDVKDSVLRNKKRKAFLQESVENINNLKEKLLSEAFSYIVYKSLLIDEDYKKHNINYIMTESKDLFAKLKAKGLIDIDCDTIFGGIYSNLCAYVDTCENKDEIEIAKTIKEQCDFEFTTCIDIIRDKVVNTINKEGSIKEAKEAYLSTGKLIHEDTKTLIRKLFEKNINLVVESEENKDLDKKDLMDLAFSETLLDYTLLESLYTLKCIDLNISNLNKCLKYF